MIIFIDQPAAIDSCNCEDGLICINEQCELSCEGINCGSGSCLNGTCICDIDFVNIENTCKETCSTDPCKG